MSRTPSMKYSDHSYYSHNHNKLQNIRKTKITVLSYRFKEEDTHTRHKESRAVNAAILVGSKNDNPENDLEETSLRI